MANISYYVRQAFRGLLKSPGFTATAVVTLSLGIGATTAMFATLYGALLRPLPFEGAGQLVMVRTSSNGGPADSTLSAQDYFDLKEQARTLQGVSALLTGAQKTTVVGEDGVENVRATFGAPDLFETLGLQPLAGRWFSPEEAVSGGPDVLVVGQTYALRRYGAEAEAIGKSITAMGVSRTIVGVVPASVGVLLETDLWAPMRRDQDVAAMPRKYNNWQVVARLGPGVSLRSAQSEADVLSGKLARQYPDSNSGKRFVLIPLQDDLVQAQKPTLLMLMGAVGLLLLIACGNVAGLLLARGAARRTELAVRAAIGASRKQVVTQLLTESLVLSAVSGMVGLLFAQLLIRILPIVSGLADQGLPTGRLDGPVLAFSLSISLLTGVLFGIAPALDTDSEESLGRDLTARQGVTGGKASSRLRSAMVTGQVALSLILLVGSSMLIRSFARRIATHPGFDPEQVFTGVIDLPTDRYPDADRCNRFLESLARDVEALPGVSGMSYISHLPVLHGFSDLAAWAADAPPALLTERPTAFRRFVAPGYFRTLRIPLLAGRDISSEDLKSGVPVIILSRHMAAELFPGRNAVGQRVMLDQEEGALSCEVIGVVGDVAIGTVGEPAVRAMYIPSRITGGQRFVIRTTMDPGSIQRSMRKLVSAKDGGLVIDDLRSLERQLARAMAPRKASMVTLTLFSVVAVLLASFGLYGVLSYLVKQRSREIGIRVALGARVEQVVWELTRHSLALTAFGMGIGVLGSLALGRVLSSQLYGISPTDPLSVAIGSLVMGGVAIVATVIPASEAARKSPLVALRHD